MPVIAGSTNECFREKWTSIWIDHYSSEEGHAKHPSLSSLMFFDEAPHSKPISPLKLSGRNALVSSSSVETKCHSRPLPPSPASSRSTPQRHARRALPQIPVRSKSDPTPSRSRRRRPMPILLDPEDHREYSLAFTGVGPQILASLRKSPLPSATEFSSTSSSPSTVNPCPPTPVDSWRPSIASCMTSAKLEPEFGTVSGLILSPALSSAAAFGFREKHRPMQEIPSEIEDDDCIDAMYTSEEEDDYEPYGGILLV